MERTPYFSARQRLTLKSCWIPGIIIATAGILSCLFIHFKMECFNSAGQQAVYVSALFTAFKWAVAFSWGPIANKEYKKALPIAATVVILYFSYIYFVYSIYSHLPPCIDTTFILVVWSCAQVAVVAFITRKQHCWQIGVAAGLIICYTTATSNSPGPVHLYAFSLPDLLTDFLLPFLVYGWMYLAENFFSDKSYQYLLSSKIQVLSGEDYLLLYPLSALSCWIIIFQSAGLLRSHATGSSGYDGDSTFLSQALVTNAITFIMEVSIFYITASLTRNIAMSRMMTIASHNDWLYLFHYLPLLNIIIWISFSKQPAQHKTPTENAVFYITRQHSSIYNYLIGLGALVSLGEVYNAYQHTRYHYAGVNGFIFLILFAKLVTYFFLDKGKTVIIMLVVLSCLAALTMFIAATGSGNLPTPLSMATVLSYFFLIEIFSPELGKTDATQLPEIYTA